LQVRSSTVGLLLSMGFMDWQLLVISFLTIFLSELGDKSQVAAIALGGSSQSPRSVFLGTAVALVLASFLGVIAGEWIAKVILTQVVKLVAAAGFLVMALRLLWYGLFGTREDNA